MTKMTGKRALMQMLRAEGVEYIFGNPGTSEGPILDALEGFPDLKYILVTQEGVAVGMADGYARASGRPAFVSLHIETGLGNGMSLLNNASGIIEEGGTPLVVTSANRDIRYLAQGRTDLADMVRLFTKWSVEVTHPQQIPSVVRRAFNEAKTPPAGPTYVAFEANALDGEADVEIVPSSRGYFRVAPDRQAVEDAARILAEAKRPVMIVGDRLGQSQGSAEAVRVAELIGARVYANSYSEMNFPTGHPQFSGRLNLVVAATTNALLSSVDAVLAVGANVFSGFFYSPGDTLGPNTRFIHVDSASREVGKSEPTDVGIIADPKTTLGELADAIASSMSGSAREAAEGRAAVLAEERAEQRTAWQRRLKDRWDLRPMSAERMMTEVASALPPDAIIVNDSGTAGGSMQGAMEFNEPGSIFGSRGGALGWGMGGAMGVKLAHPDRPVVALVGDGSAMMTVQALWTAANANIPVVYVISNNSSYRVLKLNMDTYKTHVLKEDIPRSQYIGMDFPTPLNIAGIAEATGVYGIKIEDPAELAPAVRSALELGKPAVLDVVIDGSV